MYIYIHIHAFFARTISSIFTASSLTVCQPNENSSLRQVNVQSIIKFFSPIISRGRGNSRFFPSVRMRSVSVDEERKDDQRLINFRLTIRSSVHQVESKDFSRKVLREKINSTIQLVIQSCAGKLESYRKIFLLECITSSSKLSMQLEHLSPFARDKDFNI